MWVLDPLIQSLFLMFFRFTVLYSLVFVLIAIENPTTKSILFFLFSLRLSFALIHTLILLFFSSPFYTTLLRSVSTPNISSFCIRFGRSSPRESTYSLRRPVFESPSRFMPLCCLGAPLFSVLKIGQSGTNGR